MPSKLDYLSKYTTSSAADGETEKRKRNQKREKKKKRKNVEPRSLATNLVDEDDFLAKGGSDNDDFGDYDDEGPVVVNSDALENDVQATTRRGVWKVVGSTTGESGGNTAAAAASETMRGRRHDSSSDEEAAAARKGDSKRRQRYDSSSEDNTNRLPSDLHHRRKRHDSDEDESMESTTKQYERQRRRRRRHDSSDEEEVDRENVRNRVRALRHDSSSEEERSKHRRRRKQSSRRHDSSEDEERNKHRKRRKQPSRHHDSSSNLESGRARKRRQKLDSIESDADRGDFQRRKRHDSDEDSSDGEGARMSSGHKAGLQNYKDFNKSEQKIQATKHRDAQRMVDKHGMGETVYRDKDGRKTKGEIDGREQVETSEATKRLNQGKVQQEASDARARELLDLQNSGFARYRDDNKLEEELKNEIRKDDPMARYALSKQRKQQSRRSQSSGRQQQQAPSKPFYKGPPPKANRFGIRPGYRWDGNDRGNGFEDKLLAKKFSRARKAEQSYKWSAADM